MKAARKRRRPLTAAEQALVLTNLGLVHHVARRLRSRTLPFEDLVGAGRLGLLEAAQSYDPTRGASFTTHACIRIWGACMEAIRREVGFNDGRWSRVFWRLWSSASTAELARRYRLDEDELEKMRAHAQRGPVCLDDVDEPARYTLGAEGATPEEALVEADGRRALRRLVFELPRRERTLLAERFGGPDEVDRVRVGARMELSRERVRQLERETLVYLKRRCVAQGVAP